MSLQVAIYGKGGIGKSTIAANLSACLGQSGKRVLQVGCDPKHDSTRLLLQGQTPLTILDYIRDIQPDAYQLEDIIHTGEFGVDCAEAGGPKPGIGCAGRGILSAFELLDKLGVRERGYDIILYDVLGDVVCGGFAVPIRNEYADKVYIVTSGEFMSLYAANNILRGLENYQSEQARVGGIIYNARGDIDERERVRCFAAAVGLPIVAEIPRDEAFVSAEQAQRCLVALFPGSDLSRHFQEFALELASDSPLFFAQPLSDEDLEYQVFRPDPEETGRIAEGALARQLPQIPEASATAAGDSEDATPAQTPAQTSSQTPSQTTIHTPTQTPAQTSPKTSPKTSPLLSKAMLFKEPLHGCAFNGVLSVTTQLGDCVSVAHGPKSCAHISFQTITSLSRRLLLERGTVLPMQTAPPIVSTDMSESVMIFGGETALRETIETAKAGKPEPGSTHIQKPPAVFAVSSCPSGIIGEDIEAVADLSDATTQVIPIAADGNLSGDYLQGIFLAYECIAKEVIDPTVTAQPDFINIIGEKTVANATEGNLDFIEGVLGGLGLSVNCRFICETSYEEIRNFKRAGLNLLAYDDLMGQTIKRFLEEELDAHFFEQPFPIGFSQSRQWVADLAELYGRGQLAAGVIANYQQRYDKLVSELRPILSGRKLMVVTFNHNIDWILSTALDVGMELSFVGILDYSQDHDFQTGFADDIRELHENLDYTALTRADDIERIAPDVMLGNYLPNQSQTGVLFDTVPLCPDAGFLSGINMARRWASLLHMDLGEGWRQDADLYRKHYA